MCKYAHRMSSIAMPRSVHALIRKMIQIDSRDTIGEEISLSLLIHYLFFDPFAYVSALIFPQCFSLIKLTASREVYLSLVMNSSTLIGRITGFSSITPSFSCFNSLNMDAVAFSPCLAIPLVDDIFVKSFLDDLIQVV